MTVTDCANALEVSEYEVFCRAYLRWYGNAVDEFVVERDFGRYLHLAQELPVYVRSFLSRTYVLAA